MTNSRTLAMIGSFCVGLAPLAVSPAFAQTPPEEIVVTGKYGKVPDSVQSLSQRVSYADLDLRNDKHRDILRQRVRLTARFLCDQHGEPDWKCVVQVKRGSVVSDLVGTLLIR